MAGVLVSVSRGARDQAGAWTRKGVAGSRDQKGGGIVKNSPAPKNHREEIKLCDGLHFFDAKELCEKLSLVFRDTAFSLKVDGWSYQVWIIGSRKKISPVMWYDLVRRAGSFAAGFCAHPAFRLLPIMEGNSRNA